VLAANAVTNLGDGMLLAAAPLLAHQLTSNSVLVATVTVAATLPWLLVALVSGAVVDRVDRRVLRAVIDALRAAALGVFALAVAVDVDALWMLYAVVLVVGIGETVADTAAQAMLPMIVPPRRLRAANSQMEATTLVADRMVGPVLGGVAFVTAAALPFAADAASFAVAAILVGSLRGRFRARRPAVAPEPPPHGARLRGEIGEGVRALFGEPLLRSMTQVIAVWNLLDAMMTAVLVLLAAERLGLRGAGYGALLASLAVGGLLGTLTAVPVIRRFGDGTALLASVLLSVGVAAALALTTSPVIAGGALALAGWLGVTWNVTAASLRQELVAEHLLGRVTAGYRLFALGALPVGALLGGIAAQVDVQAPYAVAAVGSLATFVFAIPRLSNAAVERARATRATR
jgi:MFS family permease